MANDVKNPGSQAFNKAQDRFAAERRSAQAKRAVRMRWSKTERRRRLTAALETLERAVEADRRAQAHHRLAILTLRAFLLPPSGDDTARQPR